MNQTLKVISSRTVIFISGSEGSPYSQCDCSAAENILIAADINFIKGR